MLFSRRTSKIKVNDIIDKLVKKKTGNRNYYKKKKEVLLRKIRKIYIFIPKFFTFF